MYGFEHLPAGQGIGLRIISFDDLRQEADVRRPRLAELRRHNWAKLGVLEQGEQVSEGIGAGWQAQPVHSRGLFRPKCFVHLRQFSPQAAIDAADGLEGPLPKNVVTDRYGPGKTQQDRDKRLGGWAGALKRLGRCQTIPHLHGQALHELA